MPCDPPGCVGSASRGSRLSASTWCVIACTDAPACFSQLGWAIETREERRQPRPRGEEHDGWMARRVAACGIGDDGVDFTLSQSHFGQAFRPVRLLPHAFLTLCGPWEQNNDWTSHSYGS